MKNRKVTILIVPDWEGTPHTIKISLLALRLGLGLAGLGFVFFLIIVFTWGGLVQKSGLADRLSLENEKYQFEQQRVFELEARVRRLQQFEDQIRRALGSNFVSDQDSEILASSIPRSVAPEVNEARATSTEKLDHPMAVSSALRPTGSSIVREGADVPSLWPVDGFISRGFEPNPVVPERSHCGVDIAGKEGAVVKATAGGIVVWTGWSARYGNLIVLAHSTGYFSVYGHNQVVLVEPRQRVERGDPIALLGNTGQSSAPHLHFEIWLGNQPLDPLELLAAS